MRRVMLLWMPLIALLLLMACSPSRKYQFNEGYIFGTIYHVIYQSPDNMDYQIDIENKMHQFDMSLSTYKTESVISLVNNNDSTVVLDHYFTTVFKKGREISSKTQGAFDMTVAPLVNAWGFGFKNKIMPTSSQVDSLLQLVGYKKVSLVNGRVIKEDPRIMLDASAIAKGYSVDVIAEFLEEKGVKNYMVEIGGEIRVKGNSKKGRPWRVGIDKPIDDPTVSQRELQDVVSLKHASMATSGNYRNFYVKDGKKYAHTIDPLSGYPVQHRLLSASVIGPNCMTADAYATAFMVLGLDKSVQIVEREDDLEAYFIYTDDKGEYQVYVTRGIKKMILPRK